MGTQARVDIDTTSFVIGENPQTLRQDAGVILTDAGRVSDLVKYTLMGKIASTGKWVPFTDETSVLGDAEFFGIYMGEDIASADIVAGDIVDVPMVYAGMKFDKDKLVIENSKTLATVIAAAGLAARSVESALQSAGLIPMSTDISTSYENA